MSNSLVLEKINYAREKKAEICEILGLSGNPTWDSIIDSINNPAGQITNVSINSSRVASWTAPTINVDSSLNPSVSYLMYVNGSYIGETTSTSYDLTNYLVEGQNTFSVKARIEFNNKDFSESNTITISFDYNADYIEVSGSDIYDTNDGLSYNCVAIDNYIFNYLQDGKSVEITESNGNYVSTTISGISRPSGYDNVSNSANCSIGDNCYIFGGGSNQGDPIRNTIAVLNARSKTVQFVNAVMPDLFNGGYAVARGTDIYIFGGYFPRLNGTSINPNLKVYKYSIIQDTLTEMNAVFPSRPFFDKSSPKCVVIGNYIYLFTEYLNALYRYDIANDTLEEVISNLATVLGSYSYQNGTAVLNSLPNGSFIEFGNDVFLFGIYTVDSSSETPIITNKVFKFIAETNQFVDCSSLFTFSEEYERYIFNIGVLLKFSNDKKCFVVGKNYITLITRNKNASV